MNKWNNVPAISISWLTSCWKTYHSKRIAESLNIQRLSASETLLDRWITLWHHDIDDLERKDHFCLKEKMNYFNKIREENTNLDKSIDNYMLEVLKSRWNIIETLTAPFLLNNQKALDENILRIYLQSTVQARACRAYLSSKTEKLENLWEKITEKDNVSRRIINKTRWIDIFNQDDIYENHDLIIDTSDFNEVHNIKRIQREKNKVKLLLWNILNLYMVILNNNKEQIVQTFRLTKSYVKNEKDIAIIKMPERYNEIDKMF